MTVRIDGQSLTIEDIVRIARGNEPIELTKEASEKINRCREVVEKLIAKREKIYGVSTGIGELSNVILSPAQVKEFQRYVVYSHAAGWGDPVAVDDARAAWLSRVNVLSKGYSGLRLTVVNTLNQI